MQTRALKEMLVESVVRAVGAGHLLTLTAPSPVLSVPITSTLITAGISTTQRMEQNEGRKWT